MVDTDHISVWAWDARPYPDFPARESVWSDDENWQRGHWISGRLGLVPLADIVRDIAAQSGLTNIDVTGLNGLIQGYHIELPMCARAALTPLSDLFGFRLAEQGDTSRFFSLGQGPITPIETSILIEDASGPITHSYPDPAQHIRDVRLHFINAGNDYQLGLASARNRLAETERIIDISAPLVMDDSFANYLCETIIARAQALTEQVQFALSPKAFMFEVGDRISLPDISGVWRIETVDAGTTLRLLAERESHAFVNAVSGAAPQLTADIIWPSRPVPIALNLPAPFVGLGVGVLMQPFSKTEVFVGEKSAVLQQPLRMGALLTPIPPGPTAYFDKLSCFEVLLPKVGLSRKTEAEILAGANRFAVETPDGWDVLQAADITLIGPNQYEFKTLLRGVRSEGYSRDGVAAGARIVWLDEGVQTIEISPELRGEVLPLNAVSLGRESYPDTAVYEGADLKPLSPVHLSAKGLGNDVRVSWIRRSRVNADNWVGEVPLGETEERYRIRIWQNEILLEEVEVNQPDYTTLHTDFTHFDVAQWSSEYGWGTVASCQFSGN